MSDRSSHLHVLKHTSLLRHSYTDNYDHLQSRLGLQITFDLSRKSTIFGTVLSFNYDTL